ncbi:MAG: L-lactate permease [Actinobacteria bacterium]|uniref:L-lactate permease n=1 Tax=Propionicimonas sp. T2.31MG-18 TaxID=3157620 RepID=UPI0035EBF83B|nr:L-lactate permease [Actinomycetota bacterium]
MFTQPLAPIAGSLALSALLAALPLILLFLLLGVFKVKAWLSALIGLAASIAVAIIGWGMPAAMAFSATAEGAFYGAFPIMWILVNAIWVYQLSVITGWFESLGQLIRSISDDQRVLAILIAFCFGALMEALAGFGAPVAISAAMLMAAGMKPVKSAVVSLLANTAPVAFGAMGAPIIALSGAVSSTHPELTTHVLSQMAGRQTPFVAAIVPLVLVFLVDGWRGVRQTWPVALTAGVVFGIAQFITANYITVEITDVVASLVTIAVVLVMLRFWKPSNPLPLDHSVVPDEEAEALKSGKLAHYPEITATGARRIWGAIAPYAIIIIVFSISQIPAVKAWLLSIGQVKFPWPGLNAVGEDGKMASTVLNAAGKPVATIFTFDHLRATGTLLLLSGIITCFVYKVKAKDAVQAYVTTIKQLKFTIVTVLSVLALAYVMNLSGQTASLGNALAAVGSAFALMSPVIGWVGVAITGSDTSANALFGLLQVTAAEKAGLNPVLMAAANSSGGVMGKMISPQNLAVAAAAVGMIHREGDIFRKVVLWSLGLLAYFTVLVVLQAGPLSWMVPTP